MANASNYTTNNVKLSIDPEYHIFISALLFCACLCGTIQNGIIIYVFLKRALILTPTNLFVFALCVLDLMFSLIGIPMVAVSSAFQRWVFGPTGCVYYGFTTGFNGLSIITMLAVISVDRYIVIVKSHLKHYINRRVALGMIAGSVAHGMFWAVCPLLGWNSYRLEGVHTSCAVYWASEKPVDIAYVLALFVFCFFIPLIIMTYCYTRIYIKVRQQNTIMRFQSTANNASRLEQEVAKTVFTMICAYILSWGPYAVVALWSVFGNTSKIPAAATVIPTVACKVSIIWNPTIYLYRNREIRRTILEVLPWLSVLFCSNNRVVNGNEPGPAEILNLTDTSHVNTVRFTVRPATTAESTICNDVNAFLTPQRNANDPPSIISNHKDISPPN